MTITNSAPSTATAAPAEPTAGLTITPIGTYIGADVTGIDLAQPLDAATVATLTDAVQRYKVLFFRGQRLDHAAEIAFGRNFGELTYAHPHDDAPPAGHPEIYTVDAHRLAERYGRDPKVLERRRYSYLAGWHTDVTPVINPPALSILVADVVPEVGGDTTWSNLVAAYEGLSAPLRAFVDGLHAEHRYGAGRAPVGDSTPYAKRINDNLTVSIHPVVRVHPKTGERALFVSPGFTSHIVELSPRESQAVLDLLFAELTRSEYTVRFRWTPDAVAFWDNRASIHVAPHDVPFEVQRTLHRITTVGEVPVGVDGKESVSVAGSAFDGGWTVAV